MDESHASSDEGSPVNKDHSPDSLYKNKTRLSLQSGSANQFEEIRDREGSIRCLSAENLKKVEHNFVRGIGTPKNQALPRLSMKVGVDSDKMLSGTVKNQ